MDNRRDTRTNAYRLIEAAHTLLDLNRSTMQAASLLTIALEQIEPDGMSDIDRVILGDAAVGLFDRIVECGIYGHPDDERRAVQMMLDLRVWRSHWFRWTTPDTPTQKVRGPDRGFSTLEGYSGSCTGVGSW